jgi:hypothetical protein
MICALEKSTRHFLWRIRTLPLIISIVFVVGVAPAFARGGGHSGGHGGGQSGGHGDHSGGHGGHHGDHSGDKHGRITTGKTARGHFTSQNPCSPTDKMSEDCPQLGEKQRQTIQAEKAEDGVEWHSR